MNNSPPKFSLDKLTVLVEGKAAKSFFENFVKDTFPDLAANCMFFAFQASDSNKTEILFPNLRTALLAFWEELQKQAPLDSPPCLVIIIDADENAEDRRATTEREIEHIKNEIEADLVANYEVLVTPCVGSNALEAALLRSVSPEFEAVKVCAETFAVCVASQNPKTVAFAQQNWTDKVIVHAMLAASENPEVPLWDSKGFKYWNPEGAELKPVFDALHRLSQAQT